MALCFQALPTAYYISISASEKIERQNKVHYTTCGTEAAVITHFVFHR